MELTLSRKLYKLRAMKRRVSNYKYGTLQDVRGSEPLLRTSTEDPMALYLSLTSLILIVSSLSEIGSNRSNHTQIKTLSKSSLETKLTSLPQDKSLMIKVENSLMNSDYSTLKHRLKLAQT